MQDSSVDSVLETIRAQFTAEASALNRLGALLHRYPKTTPEQTWEIIPFLFHNGILDEEKLRAMIYKDFLATPYWIAVAWHVKKQRPWCSLCCEPMAEPLEVHHRTYAHRGAEWRYLEDLTVLCRECHEWISKKSVAR